MKLTFQFKILYFITKKKLITDLIKKLNIKYSIML